MSTRTLKMFVNGRYVGGASTGSNGVLNRFTHEAGGVKVEVEFSDKSSDEICTDCGSDLIKSFFGKPKGCSNDKCSDYFLKNNK